MPAVRKRPAARSAAAEEAHAESEKPEEEVAPEMEEDSRAKENAGEENTHAEQEASEIAARTKELKGMGVEELKDLVDKLGLERAKKSDMVDAILELEANRRNEERERAARFRSVVVEKKKELASLTIPEMRERCNAAGIVGQLSKESRVEMLLTKWQERGGIEEALAKLANDRRESVLLSMDLSSLQSVCKDAGVDIFVKEVMVDRIVTRETQLGKFAPPTAAKGEAKVPEQETKGDLVATLLANEAARAKKKAEEERQQEMEAKAQKKKDELRALTVSELKQRLNNKGITPSGTKDELIESLFGREMKDVEAAARKADLKALGKDGVKELLVSSGVKAAGGVDAMIDAFLQHEAKREEDVRAYDVKVMEELKLKREALVAKPVAELKELCATKGISPGVSHEDRIQRLLRDAKDSGDIDKAIAQKARAARRGELDVMEKTALVELCETLEVDPFVKSVMVERLMQHEADNGAATEEPRAKKQRVGN